MCTDFMIQAADGTWVNGRSMEFGRDLETQLYIRAPKITHTFQGLGDESMELTPTYGFVGTSAFGTPICNDGLNTAGLSTGALWLPGTQYQTPDLKHSKRNVLCGFFVNWMLAHCATTDEVRHALEQNEVRVIGGQWLAKVGPLHFTVHDARGKSIVIEFLDGKPLISDNPVAVLTNRPVFQWHLDNLRNYVNLSPQDTDSIKLGNLEVQNTGHGTGLAGLPGNACPPSRFVRTTYLKQFALQARTAAEAQTLAFHLLNTVDIPKGTVRAKTTPSAHNPEGIEYDYTQWVVVKDLSNKIFNIRMHTSTLAWNIDLKTLDFNALNGKQIAIPHGQVALPLLTS